MRKTCHLGKALGCYKAQCYLKNFWRLGRLCFSKFPWILNIVTWSWWEVSTDSPAIPKTELMLECPVCHGIDVGAHMWLDAALDSKFFIGAADVKSITGKKKPNKKNNQTCSENINRDDFKTTSFLLGEIFFLTIYFFKWTPKSSYFWQKPARKFFSYFYFF